MDDERNGNPAPQMTSRLADLQAGLLDDDEAAALRARILTDPDLAHAARAFDRVREDLANLGSDARSAPDVPRHVMDRLGAALASFTPREPT